MNTTAVISATQMSTTHIIRWLMAHLDTYFRSKFQSLSVANKCLIYFWLPGWIALDFTMGYLLIFFLKCRGGAADKSFDLSSDGPRRV